jgi:hypothetical protein
MVERTAENLRRLLPAGPGFALALVLALAAACVPGCIVLSNARMGDYRRVTQNLRAENSRLQDMALDLRSQNQDLSQRAVDDARRLAGLEEAVERLERSTTAYQSEREQMAKAFDGLKQQVRTAATSDPDRSAARPRPAREALTKFASSHPGWSFDATSQTVSIGPDRLFLVSSDRLSTGAAEGLEELARVVSGAASIEVSGPAPPEVVPAGMNAGADARFLSAARAARVRDALLKNSSLHPKRVRLVEPGAAGDGAPRIEIRLGSSED